MNGLIKTTKLEAVSVYVSLAIALSGVLAVFYVMATAFTGGGVA